MTDPGTYLRSVVRVFPDYAGTVIWFVDGPVDYLDAKVTEDLVADMRAWEDAYYAGLDSELKWRSADLQDRHFREGHRIARALSDELGDSFEIEVFARDGDGGRFKLRIKGEKPGSNPQAIATFQAWARASEAEESRLRDYRASGGSFRWTVHAPPSNDDN